LFAYSYAEQSAVGSGGYVDVTPIVQQRRREQLLTDRRQFQIGMIRHNRRELGATHFHQ
jgi:hypothetical protein